MRAPFRRMISLLTVLLLAVAAWRPAPAFAAGAWQAISPATPLLSFAIDPANEQRVYTGGPGGLWASGDGGATWRHAGTVALGHELAVDPFNAAVLYASAPAGGGSSAETRLLKSVDGGATWSTVYSVAPGTEQSAIDGLLADPNRQGALFLALVGNTTCCAQVTRSLDSGGTWALILPPNIGMGGLSTAAASGPVAVPGAPGLLSAGTITYHGGQILRTTDAYAVPTPTWTAVAVPTPELTGPSLLAAAGAAAQHSLYAVYTLVGISDLVRSDNGAAAVSLGGHLPLRTASQPVQVEVLTVNPAQPRWPYLAVATTPQSPGATPQRGLFASPDAGLSWLPLPPLGQPVQQLALALQPHILYALTSSGIYRWTITWPVGADFTGYYQQMDGLRLLGAAISPLATVNGYPAQYFEKGRLEDHASEGPPPNWRFVDGLLVDELQQARAALPIGGDASSLSYAALHDLADPAKRVPPPAGYPGGGVMALPGGAAFVPFTANLAGAAGHVVPARFWTYLNRTDLFPGGWLHDVGLPISEATTVQVTKDLPGGPVQRTITVQAFQRTILTDDPLNSPGWQVERANVGTDYRKAFPARVGP